MGEKGLIDRLGPPDVVQHPVGGAQTPPGLELLDLRQQLFERAARDRVASERRAEHAGNARGGWRAEKGIEEAVSCAPRLTRNHVPRNDPAARV